MRCYQSINVVLPRVIRNTLHADTINRVLRVLTYVTLSIVVATSFLRSERHALKNTEIRLISIILNYLNIIF